MELKQPKSKHSETDRITNGLDFDKSGLNHLTQTIIGSALSVHRALGPGLLESANEVCLVYELTECTLRVDQQKPIPVVYREVHLDCTYRMDLVVEESVLVEIKSVDVLQPIHRAQLLSYLKLSGYPVRLLINFNVSLLKDEIVRLVI